MRNIKTILQFSIIICSMYSCCITRKYKLENYLLSIINDTTVCYIPLLEIVDKKIYPTLDSVIYYMENCENYNEELKYFYAYTIIPGIENNGIISYRIGAANSIKDALHIDYLKGGFYYKNYLFVVSEGYDKEKFNEINFTEKTECTLRIHPSELYAKDNFLNIADIIKKDDDYLIFFNGLCGPELKW